MKLSEVEFMADARSAVLRGAWSRIVGMVALDGCSRCKEILDCRRAVEVSARASYQKDGEPVEDVREFIYCSRCYDEALLPLIENGRIRSAVAIDLGMPLWAPPPDPTTLPLPGVMSDKQPEGSVRVVLEITDGRDLMGPEDSDEEPFPLPDDGEFVTFNGEKFPVPSMGQVESWVCDGQCEARDGCLGEPDGRCIHGFPSWLIQLGMI